MHVQVRHNYYTCIAISGGIYKCITDCVAVQYVGGRWIVDVLLRERKCNGNHCIYICVYTVLASYLSQVAVDHCAYYTIIGYNYTELACAR